MGLTLACTPQNQSKSGIDGSTLTEDSLLYAQNFRVDRLGAYQLLTVKTPWKGAQKSFKYLLYPKGTKLPTIYPEAQKIAERLIDAGLITFLGSDCHNVMHQKGIELARTKPYFHKLLDSGKLLNSEL